MNVVTITLGDNTLLDRMVGAAPSNPCVLIREESLNVNPLVITNFNLALGVGVATCMLI